MKSKGDNMQQQANAILMHINGIEHAENERLRELLTRARNDLAEAVEFSQRVGHEHNGGMWHTTVKDINEHLEG